MIGAFGVGVVLCALLAVVDVGFQIGFGYVELVVAEENLSQRVAHFVVLVRRTELCHAFEAFHIARVVVVLAFGVFCALVLRVVDFGTSHPSLGKFGLLVDNLCEDDFGFVHLAVVEQLHALLETLYQFLVVDVVAEVVVKLGVTAEKSYSQDYQQYEKSPCHLKSK